MKRAEVQKMQKLKVMRELKDMRLVYINVDGVLSKKIELPDIVNEKIWI